MKWALSALGAAVVVQWVVKEVRRVNEELDRAKAVPVPSSIERLRAQRLRRDPDTGVYRP
jgi:hypothetical protein